MNRLFLIEIFTFIICGLAYGQATNEKTDSISLDEAAKIIHLLYGPGEGTITFGDIEDTQMRIYYGLASEDKVLFTSETMNLTMGTSITLIELDNPSRDEQVIRNYVERLRDGGWRLYTGDKADERLSYYQSESFFVCNFGRGAGMTVTHLRDTTDTSLGASFDFSYQGRFKTYVLLSWGTHVASHNCMNLKATEPQNFE